MNIFKYLRICRVSWALRACIRQQTHQQTSHDCSKVETKIVVAADFFYRLPYFNQE